MKRRIVITGAGVTSALGYSRQELFQSLLDGKSAVKERPDWIEKMQTTKVAIASAVELPQEVAKSISRHHRRSMGPAALYATLAAQSALQEAAASPELLSSGRTGCIASSTLGSSSETYEAAAALVNKVFYDLSSCHFFRIVSHSSAFNIANYFGINGIQLAPCSACASSLQSIGLAYEQILLGRQDAFIAGGSDETAPVVIESFRLLHALAEEAGIPIQQLSRPFDANRCGLVCGDGAGMLFIETLEHAESHHAQPLAEIVGYATNCTGAQISQSDHASIERCMRLALDDAGLTPQDIDYVSAHATSTIAGDREEAIAIANVFGGDVPVSSLKGQLGHTLGASGALETAVIIEMMKNGIILPNFNLQTPSEECATLNLPTTPIKKPVKTVLKNCIAFGGVNAALIIRNI